MPTSRRACSCRLRPRSTTFRTSSPSSASPAAPSWRRRIAGPDGKITYDGPDYTDGGVEGCGTGTYILDTYDGYVDMAQFDPLTVSAPGYNKWRLRAGSGTDELTNLVSGEGENRWTVYFARAIAGDADRFGEGDFTGTMTCRR
jgi:hypothetical protein